MAVQDQEQEQEQEQEQDLDLDLEQEIVNALKQVPPHLKNAVTLLCARTPNAEFISFTGIYKSRYNVQFSFELGSLDL